MDPTDAETMSPALLDCRDLSKTFVSHRASVEALRGVNVTLRSGDFVAIQGSSGSGKSTLLYLAGGLMHPTDGRVSMNGTDLYALSAEERARYREILASSSSSSIWCLT